MVFKIKKKATQKIGGVGIKLRRKGRNKKVFVRIWKGRCSEVEYVYFL